MASKIRITTTEGNIIVRLYDETPIHRDNFIKLTKEGYFNGTLFHRVIKDFMIQGGDPESKGAPRGKQLGSGGPEYTLKAEICPQTCFHKRGALSAARLGDAVNPNKESSGSQFYIVWGKTFKPAELKQMEHQMAMQQEQNLMNAIVAAHRKEILELRKARNLEGLQELQDRLIAEVKAQIKGKGISKFTEKQKEAYTTIGGTPFLDGEYTVFGEVEEGLDVVEKIQNYDTDKADRPVNDVVMNVEVIS